MRRLAALLMMLATLLTAERGLGQSGEPAPEDLRALAELLRKPAIQTWLEAQAGAAPAVPVPALASTPASPPMMMEGHLDAVRDFLRGLARALPTLPDELGRVGATVTAELTEWGFLSVIALFALFAVLGFGLEWLFWWMTTSFRRRMIATPLDTVQGRLRAVWLRTVYGIGVLLAFALGSIGAFLLFDWPPLLRRIVLTFLLVFLLVRLVLVLGRILLAPGAERFRVVPMATEAAEFWFVWTAVLIGWFFFVRTTLDLLVLLGMSRPSVSLIALACGVVLLALSLYVVWRHPARETGLPQSRGQRLGSALLSVYLVVVYLLLFTGSATPFYVGIVLLLLPIAIRAAHLAVNHVLRPPGSEVMAEATP